MIISRTPFRVSFFGGGTDYPAWFQENSGQVLSTTIDKYCYISCRHLPPFFDHKYRIVYSQVEKVKNISEIEHPVVNAVLNQYECDYGLEIHHDGDLPARSGLGSSSSFTVGLLNAINALSGAMSTKESLANQAINIEQNILAENVGSQDQIATAFGGLNRIIFNPDGTYQVSPVIVQKSRIKNLQDNLLLFFTGFSRLSSDIAKTKIANMKNCASQLNEMKNMVDESISILQSPSQPLSDFGKLLHEAWQYKKLLSDKITTDAIDEIYEAGIKAGAVGGKLLGAGGGGFLMLFAEPEKHDDIKNALGKLIHVPFNFDHSGSQIVLYKPNGLY